LENILKKMGIIKLNAFFKKHITESIKKKSLFQLKGKCVAIDYSIFYYKFKKSKTKQNLLESFQKQINTFKFYNIKPIYIFDGKPNNNKFETIENRNREIFKYKKKIKEERNTILLERYKKKIVKLNNYDINLSKKLFIKNNIKYFDAIGEADDLCCKLYKNDEVCGIFTEDNDLLLGGAVIYKGLNNFNDTIYEYNLKEILKELNMNYNVFLKMCLLAGTTYTKKIYSIFTLYDNYKNNIDINNKKYEDKEILYSKYVKNEILNSVPISVF
jgi:5'-3' exonuclease